MEKVFLMSSCVKDPTDGYNLRTSFGSYFLPFITKTQEDAKNYCESTLNKTFAILRSQPLIDELQNTIANCFDYSHSFLIGLRSQNGIGTWLDGMEFEDNKHAHLFGDDKKKFEDDCKNYFFVKNHTGLHPQPCTSSAAMFFCEENQPTYPSATTSFQTTDIVISNSTAPTKPTEPNSSQNFAALYAVGAAVIVLTLLLIVLVLFKSKLCKKLGDASKPMTTNQVFDGTSECGMKVNEIYCKRNRDDTLPQPKLHDACSPQPLIEVERTAGEDGKEEGVNFYCTILDPADKT